MGTPPHPRQHPRLGTGGKGGAEDVRVRPVEGGSQPWLPQEERLSYSESLSDSECSSPGGPCPPSRDWASVLPSSPTSEALGVRLLLALRAGGSGGGASGDAPRHPAGLQTGAWGGTAW